MDNNSKDRNIGDSLNEGANNEDTNVENVTSSCSHDSSQSLVDIANNTFKELCRTLESEHNKLLELEERRKTLQAEMQRLKQEIDEEKHSFRLNLVESLSDNANAMSGADSSQEDEEFEYVQTNLHKKLDTCYEEDEEIAKTDNILDDAKYPENDVQIMGDTLHGVMGETFIARAKYEEEPKEFGPAKR